MPFEELDHTADLSLRVWAADLIDLFLDAAVGMYALAGISWVEEPRIERIYTASAPDEESLLISFLTELVYYIEQDQLAFDRIDLSFDLENGKAYQLHAILSGTSILSLGKTIKAVTFHNLQIKKTKKGVEVDIVFDA